MTRHLTGAAVFVLIALAAAYQWGSAGLSIYGTVLFALLALKLAASTRSRPVEVPPEQADLIYRLRVGVVIAAHNEDAGLLRACLQSLLTQTRRPDAVALVDDVSTYGTVLAVADEFAGAFAAAGIEFRTARLETRPQRRIKRWFRRDHWTPVNHGKREALAVGWQMQRHMGAYVGIDSDTRLHPDAIHELIKPFIDPRVLISTGLVLASNHRKNLLTRLIDLRYANAFLYERAAYSRVGSVLCACGSLVMLRSSFVWANVDAFLGQRFLGRRATFGDDRHLTNLALRASGRSVFQETAIAWTAVPERIGHYLRQQVRWNKSFFRESLWALRHLPIGRPAFWLTLIELTSWIAFTTALIIAVAIRPAATGQVLIGTYVLYLVLLGYARSVRYFDVTSEHISGAERVGVFLLAPLYGLMHIVLLMGLRLYSLATIRSNRWGTRSRVEVSLAAGV